MDEPRTEHPRGPRPAARLALATLALACATTLPSCLAVAAAGAVGFVQYDRNEAECELDADLDAAFAAAEVALGEQGLVAHEAYDDDPTSRTLDGEDVRVVVERVAAGRVRVRVRVGTFATDDNARRANLIIEQISREL